MKSAKLCVENRPECQRGNLQHSLILLASSHLHCHATGIIIYVECRTSCRPHLLCWHVLVFNTVPVPRLFWMREDVRTDETQNSNPHSATLPPSSSSVQKATNITTGQVDLSNCADFAVIFQRQSCFDSARYCGAIEAETPASHDHIAGCHSEDHRSTHWSWYVCLHYIRLRELSCPVGHAILNPRSCGDVFQV